MMYRMATFTEGESKRLQLLVKRKKREAPRMRSPAWYP
jgi:hypothetical protein